MRDLQHAEDTECDSQFFAIAQINSIGKTSTISATISSLNELTTLNVLPDTGADIIATYVKVLKLLGVDVNNLLQPVSGPTSSVDGSPIKSLDQLPIETVQIFLSIQGNMLMSWRTAQRLRILSENYTSQIKAINNEPMISLRKQNIVTTNNLINEFPTVFNRWVRVMNGELFKTNLRDDTKPFCISTLRSISYAFRDKVKKMDFLQSQGIIEPAKHPTEWCASPHPLSYHQKQF